MSDWYEDVDEQELLREWEQRPEPEGYESRSEYVPPSSTKEETNGHARKIPFGQEFPKLTFAVANPKIAHVIVGERRASDGNPELRFHCVVRDGVHHLHGNRRATAYLKCNPDGTATFHCFVCKASQDDFKRAIDEWYEREDPDPMYGKDVQDDIFGMTEEQRRRDEEQAKQSSSRGAQEAASAAEPPSSWDPVDLLALANQKRIEPTIGLIDGEDWALFYAGAVNEIHAKPENMKTWISLLAAAEVLRAGKRVIILDFEDGGEQTLGRLRALGLTDDDINRIWYAHPSERLVPKEVAALMERMTIWNPALVVFNGVIEALALDGKDTLNNQHYTSWSQAFARPLARAGACVLLVDHISVKSDGKTAIGASAKANFISGASYVVESAELLAPALTTTVRGSAVLKLAKDRPGGIRARGYETEKAVAVARFYARPGDHVDGHFEAVTEATKQDPTVRQTIMDSRAALLRHVAENPGISFHNLVAYACEHLDYTRKPARAFIQTYIDNGYFKVVQDGNAQRLYVDSNLDDLT
jgi:hypothetical protein